MSTDQKNDGGGPAFPVSIPGWGDNGASGMTLRDWFAGQALEIAVSEATRRFGHLCPETRQRSAQEAYALADAMLAAREGRS